jgi:hypothetical protein
VEGPSVPPPSTPVIPAPPTAPTSDGSSGGLPTPLLVIIGAALVAAIGLLLTMPGGSDQRSTALSPIAQAAEQTAALPGARFEGSGSGSFAEGSMTMKFSGVYDGTGQRSEVNMGAQVTGPQSMSMSMTAIQDGLVMYMSSPLFSNQLPNGAQWLKVDYSQLGADAADLRASNSMDGRQVLEQLDEISGSTQTVGLESVRGVTTTHYRGTIDAGALDDQLSDSSGGAADVWIDRKGFVRRVDMQLSAALPGEAPTQIAMTMEFFDFGVKPQITAPAAADTVDFTQLGQQALDSVG